MKSNNVKIGGGGSLDKNKQRSQNPWRKPGIVRLFPGLRHGLCGGLCIALLLLTASAGAETIIFPDDPTVELQAVLSTTERDLAPAGLYRTGGGTSFDGKSNSLDGNVIILNDNGHVPGLIFGAYYVTSDVNYNDYTAKNNSITINGGSAGISIRGARVQTIGSPGHVTALVKENTITIVNGTLDANMSSIDITGGSSDTISTNDSAEAVAQNNRVTIKGGKVEGLQNVGITGGQAFSRSSNSNVTHISHAQAIDNHVVINSNSNPLEGQFFGIMGGYASARLGVNAAAAAIAEASCNSVTIEDGTIRWITGGSAEVSGSTVATGTGTAIAKHNIVALSGGTVTSIVRGGNAYISNTSGTATVTHNTVNISGSPNLTTADLYGGSISTGIGGSWSEDSDVFTGNTLNLSSQIEVAEVGNFEYLNFILPADTTAGDTLLSVTGTAFLGNGDGKDSEISVDASGITTLLDVGDQFVILDAETLEGTPVLKEVAPARFGATLVYDFELYKDDNRILMDVTSVAVRQESKIFSEGFLAGSILLNQTGDMIAQRTEQARCGTFLDFTGGSSRYNTGSHVDMKGFSLLTGITRCVNTASGKMTYGAFFEYGNGNDTGLYVTGARGNSDVYHYGGGLLGRLNLRNSVYAEGSFRAGAIDNGFTSDLLDGAGNAAGYDSSSAYIGTHIGLGRKLKLSSRNTLDLYSKYFWTHQNGDRVTLSTNDPVKFAGIDSHRVRLGGRSNYVVNRRLSTYLGAAWEHEFAGTARATTYGYAIDSPSLRGSTGIGELGVSLKAQRALPLAFDFGVQGYIGKREGVAGSVQVRWMW